MQVNKNRVALVLAIETFLGHQMLGFLPKPLLKIAQKINGIKTATMHMQPVFTKGLTQHSKQRITKEFIEFFTDFYKKSGFNLKPVDYICFENIDVATDLTQSIPNSEICATKRLNLNKSLDEIFSPLPHTAKNLIRRAEKSNLNIFEDMQGEMFYKALKICWKGIGLAVNHESYYINLKKYLFNNVV